jgi:transcriptional regulator with XRE-family HTH domain
MLDRAPDETGASALSAAIGERVRHERQARRWTLDQLAGSAGVSRRTLIDVEQGVANPSVGTLLRIAEALGVGLPALVEPPQRKPVRVTRRGEGAALWSGVEGGRGVLVASIGAPDLVELWDWSMAPGDHHASEAHTPGARELLQVQQGTIALQVGDQQVELAEGDAVAFPADVPHGYRNAGAGLARFILTVFEPGARPARRGDGGNG